MHTCQFLVQMDVESLEDAIAKVNAATLPQGAMVTQFGVTEPMETLVDKLMLHGPAEVDEDGHVNLPEDLT